MAITLDRIVNKVFKVVKNGYDNNEVEAFLDEILEEMENREAETEKLKAQVASLSAELEQAKAQAAARPVQAVRPARRPADHLQRSKSESGCPLLPCSPRLPRHPLPAEAPDR